MHHRLHRLQRNRRRLNKTNYSKRLKLLKSGKPRLVVRRTNKRIITQIVKYEPDGDVVLANASSTELKDMGWKGSFKNIPASYLTGMLIAKKAKEAGVKEAILDIGLHTPAKGARIFAVAKGAAEAGLKLPLSDEIVPSQERLMGEHVKDSNVKTIKSKLVENGKE